MNKCKVQTNAAREPRYTEANERLGRSRRIKPFEVSNATDVEPERFESEARPVDPENGRSVTSPICWGKKKLEP